MLALVQLENMVSVELGATVSGKVSRVNATEILIAISDGNVGIIRIPYSGQGEAAEQRFCMEEQVTARVTAREQNGRYVLTPLIAESDRVDRIGQHTDPHLTVEHRVHRVDVHAGPVHVHDRAIR